MGTVMLPASMWLLLFHKPRTSLVQTWTLASVNRSVNTIYLSVSHFGTGVCKKVISTIMHGQNRPRHHPWLPSSHLLMCEYACHYPPA